jgi:hypothetical protein
MVQAGESTLTAPGAISSRPVAEAQALIEEARRRHRRRQAWMAAGVVTVVAVGLVVAVTVGGGGGSASHSHPSPPGGTVARRVPPPAGPASSDGAVAIGGGPTAIDFVSADRGWMATGCASYCYQSNPQIIRTDDGGRTWRNVHPPDMAATAIAGSVWYQYGGVVEVRFVSPSRGWYLQAGELWSTSDGGQRWRLVFLGGVVKTMATSDGNAWAVVDSCPNGALLACGANHLYVESSTDRAWHRIAALSPGEGGPSDPTLVAAGGTALVSFSGGMDRATPGGTLVPVDASCAPVGPLTPGRLAGLCGAGGGGDASAVSFAVSADHGRTWRRFVGGPPSDGWSGATATNGHGALFYVTGGTTLWRVDTTGRTWQPVLQTPAHTTDQLYPLYFADGELGFVGQSGSSGMVLFVTRDGGLTWRAMPPP